MHVIKRLFFGFINLVILTVATGIAGAQGLSFSIAPMITEVNIASGGTQTGLVTIRNDAATGAGPLRLKVQMQDWTLDEYGNSQFSTAGSAPDSCANWIQITPLELSIEAGQSQQVRYTISAPSVAQGTYHCIIFFTSAPFPSVRSGTSVGIYGCIGNTIYVQVGTPVKRAKIDALSLTSKNVALTVENTGSSYLRLGGTVKIADSAGNVIQQVTIPGVVVLPGTNNKRIVTMNTSSPVPNGSYILTAVLDYGGEALLGARTNANLQ